MLLYGRLEKCVLLPQLRILLLQFTIIKLPTGGVKLFHLIRDGCITYQKFQYFSFLLRYLLIRGINQTL